MLNLAHPADVLSLALSADKSRLVTGAADGFAHVWDLATGRVIQAIQQAGPVRSVLLAPNGTLILPNGEEKAVVIHTPPAVRTIEASKLPLRALAVTPNGAQVLTGGDDKIVKVWNLANGNVERTFPAAEGVVRALAVSRNNALVAVGGDDQTVRVLQLADAKPVATIKAPDLFCAWRSVRTTRRLPPPAATRRSSPGTPFITPASRCRRSLADRCNRFSTRPLPPRWRSPPTAAPCTRAASTRP